jgi:hypothetical protein
LQIERSLPHGHVAAALGMIRQIALDRLILSTAKDAASGRYCDLVLAMMVDRLIAPRSKLGFVRAVDEETAVTSLGAVLGLGKVKDYEAYEALDWLLERHVRIESGLARRHLEDGVLVLYDVSSSYFEGRHCPLAQFGHSRDHRGEKGELWDDQNDRADQDDQVEKRIGGRDGKERRMPVKLNRSGPDLAS